jgi:uncharacterized membrane protein
MRDDSLSTQPSRTPAPSQSIGATSDREARHAAGGAERDLDGPVQKAARLVGVDATRGLALLGMIAVHALWAYDDDGEITWYYALAAGRSAATFALLAGVGIAFMTRRRRVERGERTATAASLAARAGVIGAIGLLLGGTDAELATVILGYYAVLFVLAIPAVFLSTRVLLATGATIAVVVPVLSHLVRPGLPQPAGGNVSVLQLFQDPVGLLTQLTLTGLYPALPWMAYVCIGIAIGRMQLSSHRVAVCLLAVGSAAAVGAWALSSVLLGPLGGRAQLYAAAQARGLDPHDVDELLIWGGDGSTPTDTWWWLATAAPHTTTPLDLMHTIGVATALLGGMLLLARRHGDLLAPIAAAGSMTLTLYTASVLFLNSPWNVLEATTSYFLQVIAAIAFAVAWKAAVGRGPLEALAADAARAARQAVERRQRLRAETS